MGGWVKLSCMETADAPFRRKEFLDTYPVYRRRDQDYFPMVAGTYKDYKFLGYGDEDNLEEVVQQLNQAEYNQAIISAMMSQAHAGGLINA